MKTVVEFDYKKATQALNFFALEEGGSISKLKAVKLMWLADRYHLRKYGRPITNDTYYAMKFGPVGSSVKDFAECSDFLAKEETSYLNHFLECDRKQNVVTSKKEVDFNSLSESDVEALSQIYKNFGKLSPAKLVDYSHGFPEWSKFKTELNSKGSTRQIMSYTDFFSNPEKEDAFFHQPKKRTEAARELFEENFEIANFWVSE